VAPSLLLLALSLWLPAEARAQWASGGGNTTTPDKVGVGSATELPQTQLDVFGSNTSVRSTFGGTTGANGKFQIFSRDIANNPFGEFQMYAPAGAGSEYLRFNLRNSSNTIYADVFTINRTGNVGVGTASPGSLFEVRRDQATGTEVRVTNATAGGFAGVYLNGGFAQAAGGFLQWNNVAGYQNLFVATGGNYPLYLGTNNNIRMTVLPTSGNVGIGPNVTNPAALLHVGGQADNLFQVVSTGSAATDTVAHFVGGAGSTLIVRGNGKVGVGTTSPAAGYRLDVVGGLKVTHTAGATDGNLNVDGTINAKYQDVAEWVPSTQKLPAGTVVVLDAARTNHVLASSSAYDTKVAGVVSEQPGLILGEGGEGKVMVATTGRVKVKVDATRAAIRVGDLLVTSGVEGVAMSSVPVDLGGTQIHRPGTIIGKALEPLEKGVGEILVLLSLQ
jgi:hypothetical protein